MSVRDLWLTVGGISAATVATGAAGALLVRAERRGRRIVTGLLGDDRRPGALDRLETVELTVQQIQAELSPNSGKSLHDRIVRIDERLVDHIASPHPRR